jgi:hypothetical protein
MFTPQPMIERNHIDVVNECIVNVLIAHPFISQQVKDEILRDGALMADYYANKRDKEITSEDLEGLFGDKLEKQTAFEARSRNFQLSVNRYAATNALTRRFLDKMHQQAVEGEMGLGSDFASAEEYNVVVSQKSEKLVPLLMNTIKGFNARPTCVEFSLTPDCEAIIEHCEKSRRILVINEPTFLYKERNYQVLEPKVFTYESWVNYVASNKFKIAIYMIYPMDTGVEITYALV